MVFFLSVEDTEIENLRKENNELRKRLHAASTKKGAGSGGVAHFALDWRQPRALVLGSEAHGVADQILSDGRTARCHIPQAAGIESLNAAMAGSVMLFEAQRQRLEGGAGLF